MKLDFDKMVQEISEEGARRAFLTIIKTMIDGFCETTKCEECKFKTLMEFGNGENACFSAIIDFAIKQYNLKNEVEE